MNMEVAFLGLLFVCLIVMIAQRMISEDQKEIITKQKELIGIQEDRIKKQDYIILKLENKIRVYELTKAKKEVKAYR